MEDIFSIKVRGQFPNTKNDEKEGTVQERKDKNRNPVNFGSRILRPPYTW